MHTRLALLSLLTGALLGCSDSSTNPESPAAAKPAAESLVAWAPSADLSLAGDAVVAIPSLAERWDSVADLARYRTDARKNLQKIFADWRSRRPLATDWEVLSSLPQTGGTLHLVAFSVDGIAQGGLLWVPTSTKPTPVVLFGHPGDDGMDDGFFSVLALLMGTTKDQCIVAMPAFRGEPAALSGTVVTSDATLASPWDRDVDDGLAMLGAVLEKTPNADASRIAAVGYSRGAGVALLSALRDRRVKGVFEIAGPTDFFAPSIQNLSKALAAGRTIDLPGLATIETAYLSPFRAGRISADSLRTVLLARSAARMALSGLLPSTVAIHGAKDTTVYPDQPVALDAADPRVDYQSFPGMNHTSMFFGGDQAKVAQSLQTFLKTTLGI